MLVLSTEPEAHAAPSLWNPAAATSINWEHGAEPHPSRRAGQLLSFSFCVQHASSPAYLPSSCAVHQHCVFPAETESLGPRMCFTVICDRKIFLTCPLNYEVKQVSCFQDTHMVWPVRSALQQPCMTRVWCGGFFTANGSGFYFKPIFFYIKIFITKTVTVRQFLNCQSLWAKQFSITFNTKLDSHRSHALDPKALWEMRG